MAGMSRESAGDRSDGWSRLIARFAAARGSSELAVLEGLHPVKHALRFGAELLTAVSPDPGALAALAGELAPDVAPRIAREVREVPPEVFARLAPAPPHTGLLALARRPPFSLPDLLAAAGPAPAVALERPVHLGNLGAAVRAAAAAGAAGLICIGPHDPWRPEALRGGAGLQFALPVGRCDALPASDRPLVAFQPGGEPLSPEALPPRAVLLFGNERRGLSPALRARAHRVLAIPMRPGVSSLNLATAVALALYARRFAESRRGDTGSGNPAVRL